MPPLDSARLFTWISRIMKLLVGENGVGDEDVDLGQELLLVLVQLVGGDVAELGVLPDLVGGAGAHRGAVQVEAGLLVIVEYDQDPRKIPTGYL